MATKPVRGRSSVEKVRGPVHPPSVWAGALAILLLLFIISMRVLGGYLYDFPPNPDPKQFPNATVICLAGGKYRIEAALALYAQGVGDRLLIVGAGKKSTPQSLVNAHGAGMEISQSRFNRIHVETESRNTIENAFAVRRLLQQRPEVDTIILVTSGYHLRRAQLTIENQIRPGVKIIPFAPANEAIQKANWWHTLVGMQVTTVEYFKFLLASLLIPRLGYF